MISSKTLAHLRELLIPHCSCHSCDRSDSGNLVVDLPIASMIAVTTSFDGTIYTTALPTLFSSSSSTDGSSKRKSDSNTGATTKVSSASRPSRSSRPGSGNQLSVGAGVGIGIAASVVVVLLIAIGLIILKRSRKKRASPSNGTHEDPGASHPYYGYPPMKNETSEIDGRSRPPEADSFPRHELNE